MPYVCRGGAEQYDKSKDAALPDEVEHIYPDYELYGITMKMIDFNAIKLGLPP